MGGRGERQRDLQRRGEAGPRELRHELCDEDTREPGGEAEPCMARGQCERFIEIGRSEVPPQLYIGNTDCVWLYSQPAEAQHRGLLHARPDQEIEPQSKRGIFVIINAEDELQARIWDRCGRLAEQLEHVREARRRPAFPFESVQPAVGLDANAHEQSPARDPLQEAQELCVEGREEGSLSTLSTGHVLRRQDEGREQRDVVALGAALGALDDAQRALCDPVGPAPRRAVGNGASAQAGRPRRPEGLVNEEGPSLHTLTRMVWALDASADVLLGTEP
jgi:hypothetical protein